MSKERLERLKAKRVWKSADGVLFHTADKEDYEWLIEQAERVEELEEKLYDLKESAYETQIDFLEANGERNSLLEQNKRYREAIEKAIQELEEDINIIDCARNAHYRLKKALEGEKRE